MPIVESCVVAMVSPQGCPKEIICARVYSRWELIMRRVNGATRICCPYCYTTQFVEAVTTDFRIVVNQSVLGANVNCQEEFTVSEPYKLWPDLSFFDHEQRSRWAGLFRTAFASLRILIQGTELPRHGHPF